jgi:signal transduction histidine kinase/DNA-binding response OmpR family regulator
MSFVISPWLLVGVAAAALAAALGKLWLDRRRLGKANARQEVTIESLRDEVWELKEAAAARDRAEAASEAKSRFLATVSHEIRTPLSGILGLADLLADSRLDAEQQAYVEAIKTSGGALASLIHEILDFSKIEAGKIDLAREAIDLPSLVEGIVELLAPRAHGKGIEIASFIGADVADRMFGDPARLQQVLMNLAGNAVKFTDAGGVGIRVLNAGTAGVCFSVEDTGIGVAPENQALIFDEFEQGDGSSTRRHAGTGLGLAIAKRLVERMGGEISLASVVGQGSTFSFSLPLEATDRSGAGVRPNLAHRRVLLVARSIFEAPFIARLLGEAGAEVECAKTEEAALAALGRHPGPEVVIVDCALGEAATRSVAAAARAAHVGQSLILFSPFERRAFGQASLHGFQGWLVKPVRARSLFARLTDEIRCDRQPRPRGSKAVALPRRLRVLLAEDDDINAMIAMAFLHRLGVAATHVKDGEAALALAEEALGGRRDPYDAIVMDVRMPGLDGHEVARRLRRIEAEAGRTPMRLVALTANSLAEDRRASLAAGFDVFLTKPVDLATLGEAIAGAPSRVDATGPPHEVEA